MYGAQTQYVDNSDWCPFENDVEMYGAQTVVYRRNDGKMFENDVEMYGAQTISTTHPYE